MSKTNHITIELFFRILINFLNIFNKEKEETCINDILTETLSNVPVRRS